MERRRWMVSVAALVTAAVLAAGCGGDDGGDSATSNPPDSTGEAGTSPGASPLGTTAGPADGDTPVAGGRLVFGLEAEPEGLDPTRYAFSSSGHFVASAVMETLTTLDENGEPVPYLAESVEPNDDYTVWTITIRPGVTFHDGTELTTDVVVQNLEAHIGSIITKASMVGVESVEAISDTQVEVTYADPYASFDAAMATQIGYMISPAMIEDPAYTLAPIGTGPFVFQDHVKDQSWTFTRNPNYWREDRPYLESIEFRPIVDNVERVNALASGDVDAIIVRSPAEVRALRETDNKQVENNAGEEDFLSLNTEAPPFDSLTARQAVAAATDSARWREEISLNEEAAATSPFAPGQLGALEDNGYPAYDLERARELVAQYEEESGEPFAFVLRTQADTNQLTESQLLESMYEEAGMDVTVEALPQINHVAQIASGNYQMGRFRLFGNPNPDPDAMAFWRSTSVRPSPDISLNFPRFASDTVDNAIRAATATKDPEARDEAYQTVNRTFAEEIPYLWLGRATWILAANPRVNGIYAGANGTVQTIGSKTWVSDLWIDQ